MSEGVLASHASMPAAAVADEFLALGRQLAQERARLEEQRNSRVRLYLLFERWRDNPLAALFEACYPQQAAARLALPDDLYKDQPDDAPCVVAINSAVIPCDPGKSFSDYLAYEWLGGFLQQAWQGAQLRRSLQGLCGVLFASVDARILVRHLAQLGYQRAPDGQARLLRYQDPRVLQRVWPALNEAQKQAWLGPIRSWWSLQMPWGPVDQAASPAWFLATQPPLSATSASTLAHPRSALLQPRQWLLAHSVAATNAVWLRYAQQGIEARQQPSAGQMNCLLAAALDGGIQTRQLEHFLLCVWQPYLAPPTECIRPLAGEVEVQLKARCASVAERLAQHPQAGFKQLIAMDHGTDQDHHDH